MWFVNNCRHPRIDSANLTVRKLGDAEEYWIRVIQEDHFAAEIVALKANRILSNSSFVLAFVLFLTLMVYYVWEDERLNLMYHIRGCIHS